VLAVTPLDGVSSHFQHGLFQVLDLAVGEWGMGEHVGEHVMGLFKVSQLAANIEIDLSVGSPLQVLVVPEERLLDDVVELIGREWLDQVTIGPDPHARGPMLRILERGHHNNGDQIGLSIPLQLIANGKAVDVRQHEIEQDQFRFLQRDGRPDLRTRVKLDRFEVASPNEAGQNIVGVALIVDDQNGAPHGENSKKPRNLERFLFLATIDGDLCSIFARASKRDKGLESTSSPVGSTIPTFTACRAGPGLSCVPDILTTSSLATWSTGSQLGSINVLGAGTGPDSNLGFVLLPVSTLK